MAAAASLDEVIDVHEAYLLSIQRQCFVVPDKLVRGCLLLSSPAGCIIYRLMIYVVGVWLHVFQLFSFCIQGALISSRINSILGLALDFYAVQQTLSSSGSVSSMKARCEMEVNQIEKQFDDCIAFLLRVIFLSPPLLSLCIMC